MEKIAIVGTGPTGIYTLFSLLERAQPLAISLYEKEAQAGIGMPYNEAENSRLMLANIASIEIPPITSTYLDWLKAQDQTFLAEFGVDKETLHDRQFLPRVLLGQFFRDQFLALVDSAAGKGCTVDVHEHCEVTDLESVANGVKLWCQETAAARLFDLVVIATGHTWPDGQAVTRTFFPSPWSGLLQTSIPACEVGVLGTSLSALDATMAVVAQHGTFSRHDDGSLRFDLAPASRELKVTLMSRSGILPEADFYCPIPHEPLQAATPRRIREEIAAGVTGLLNRVFRLIVQEIQLADPAWSQRVGLADLTADSFADAYFADRERHDPFRWADFNLEEVERNRRERRTVPWRYAILRLHEPVQDIVPHLEQQDRERFMAGLCKVFVDNYAAIPPESIRRLLALHKAGVIEIVTLGSDYDMTIGQDGTRICVRGREAHYPVFIDARGQQPLQTRDMPFPRLRQQLMAEGEEFPDIGEDYTLLAPASARGRIALGALPFLVHDRPFVQGVTASAEIGSAISHAVLRRASRTRKRLLLGPREPGPPIPGRT